MKTARRPGVGTRQRHSHDAGIINPLNGPDDVLGSSLPSADPKRKIDCQFIRVQQGEAKPKSHQRDLFSTIAVEAKDAHDRRRTKQDLACRELSRQIQGGLANGAAGVWRLHPTRHKREDPNCDGVHDSQRSGYGNGLV